MLQRMGKIPKIYEIKEASWLYAELFPNDKILKNVNDKEWNLAICHVTLSLT